MIKKLIYTFVITVIIASLAYGHGVHSGTGPIIATKLGPYGSRYFMIAGTEREDSGALKCDHIKYVAFLHHTDESDGGPKIHLLDTYECSEWDNL